MRTLVSGTSAAGARLVAALAALHILACSEATNAPPARLPNCGDGVRNGSESDVDCGGDCSARCARGRSCGRDADCASGVCYGGTCAPDEPPRIDRISPPAGPTTGGTLLRIDGRRFPEGSIVTVDGVVAGEVSVKSPILILAVAPPHASGLVDVQVVLPDGSTLAAPASFGYFDPASVSDPLLASSVAPSLGPVDGGTLGVVRGARLGSVQRIFFGDKEGAVLHAAPDAVAFRTPAHAGGTVDVRVVAADHQVARLDNAFTFAPAAGAAPRIDAVSPATLAADGPAAAVSVLGEGFSPTAMVFIDGAPVAVQTAQPARLQLLVGPLAAGRYDVAVTNPDGATATRAQGLVVAAACDDRVPNGGETDIDCGGPCGATCEPDRTCAEDRDCVTFICVDNRCALPTCARPGPRACDSLASCTDGERGRTCTCPAGYLGDGFACTDDDECKAGTAACAADATCENRPGGYRCVCKPGFEGDGTACRPIDYAWRTGEWSACSNGCGPGRQTRTVECTGDGVVVGDEPCGTPPPAERDCAGTSSCTHAWTSGEWGACSTTCGQGSRARTVACQRSDGAVVEDAACAEAKPAVSQACTDTSSCTFDWAAGAWGACSATCGNGEQTRTVSCRRSDGQQAEAAACAGPAPAAAQACNDTSGCTYEWVASGWGECSSTCGSGTQSRTVACRRSDATPAYDSACTGTKPAESQACTGTSGCTYAYGSWSAWSGCSASCGGGTQSRTRPCTRSDGASASCSACGGACSESRSCNTQACCVANYGQTCGTAPGYCANACVLVCGGCSGGGVNAVGSGLADWQCLSSGFNHTDCSPPPPRTLYIDCAGNCG